VPLKDDKRQKNQLQQSLAFPETGRGEAPARSRRGTESSVAKRKSESPASTDQLMRKSARQRTVSRHWHESRAIKAVRESTG